MTPDTSIHFINMWINAISGEVIQIFIVATAVFAAYKAMKSSFTSDANSKRLDRHGAQIDVLQTNSQPPGQTNVAVAMTPIETNTASN